MLNQIIDPAIAKVKFDKETDLFKTKPEPWLPMGWEFKKVDYPSIHVVFKNKIGIVVDCSNYDFEPPSVTIVDKDTFKPLLRKEILTLTGKNCRLLLDNHPITHMPFICMEGFWEYHKHTSHVNNSWESHKKDKGIYYCIDRAFSILFD